MAKALRLTLPVEIIEDPPRDWWTAPVYRVHQPNAQGWPIWAIFGHLFCLVGYAADEALALRLAQFGLR